MSDRRMPGRPNPMVALCRHLHANPLHRKPVKLGRQALAMGPGRRLDVYEAANDGRRITDRQRRRLAKKRAAGRHLRKTAVQRGRKAGAK